MKKLIYEIITYDKNDNQMIFYPTSRKQAFKNAIELKATNLYKMVIVQVRNDEEILADWTI